MAVIDWDNIDEAPSTQTGRWLVARLAGLDPEAACEAADLDSAPGWAYELLEDAQQIEKDGLRWYQGLDEEIEKLKDELERKRQTRDLLPLVELAQSIRQGDCRTAAE